MAVSLAPIEVDYRKSAVAHHQEWKTHKNVLICLILLARAFPDIDGYRKGVGRDPNGSILVQGQCIRAQTGIAQLYTHMSARRRCDIPPIGKRECSKKHIFKKSTNGLSPALNTHEHTMPM